jgi:hypothetical protein
VIIEDSGDVIIPWRSPVEGTLNVLKISEYAITNDFIHLLK